MDKKEAPVQQLTSHRRRTERSDAAAGFTLLEMVCVVAIMALLAAILLPRVPRATTRPRLEAYAVELASLLKGDRNAAIARRGSVAAQVDGSGRLVRSGAGDRTVRIPDDVAFDALLPERCNGRPGLSSISFFATGMSCGGVLRLSRFASGFEIRVNWLTGGIDIVARNAL
jgi:general secretion pathway protein H